MKRLTGKQLSPTIFRSLFPVGVHCAAVLRYVALSACCWQRAFSPLPSRHSRPMVARPSRSLPSGRHGSFRRPCCHLTNLNLLRSGAPLPLRRSRRSQCLQHPRLKQHRKSWGRQLAPLSPELAQRLQTMASDLSNAGARDRAAQVEARTNGPRQCERP